MVRAFEELVEQGADSDLHRINVIEPAARALWLDRVVDAFVHASKLGLFDMSWNLLCPGYGGLLDASAGARGVRAKYDCNRCATAYSPDPDVFPTDLQSWDAAQAEISSKSSTIREW